MNFVQKACFPVALSCVFVSCSSSARAQTAMGVNYNGQVTNFNITDVQTTNTVWVRAFYDVTALLATDGTCAVNSVQNDANLTELNTIHSTYPTYKLLLNLKYDFSEWGGGTPPTSGTNYNTVVTCTNRILDYVYPSISQLVSGNEPFITNPPTMAAVTTFYEQITDNDISYNNAHASQSVTGTAIPLYVGAFNNLEKTSFQTTPVNNLMLYAKNTAGVTGIDLHLHVSSFDGNNGAEGTDSTGGLVAAVNYAQSIFGTTKMMMSSEFSLVNYFEKFLGNDLSSSFLTKYPDPTGNYLDVTGNRTMLGFINYAQAISGVPRAEWLDFLNFGDAEYPTWYTDRTLSANGIKNFLAKSEAEFSASNFSVATYAIQQGHGQLTSSNPAAPYAIQPWQLNAMFCNSTCTNNPTTGNDTQNEYWLGDFQAQSH